MPTLRKFLVLVFFVMTCCSKGCTSPRVTFLASRCEDLKENDRLKALIFRSTFDVRHLKNEQLVYQVRLFDKNGVPIRSRDGRYETSDGIVAGTTSVIVLQSRQRFTDVRVTIPAKELGVPANALPALAVITIHKATGARVGKAICRLPRLHAGQIAPPLTTNRAPTVYWFAKVIDPNELPILLGPFNSVEEADKAVVDKQVEPPKRVNSDSYLWFVPLLNRGDPEDVTLIGPCCCEEDAVDIGKLIADMPDAIPEHLLIGGPIEVQVGQWLKQRKGDGRVASE